MTTRTIRRSIAVAILLARLFLSESLATAGDIIPDENLEAAIKKVLRRQGKDEIKEEDLQNVYQVTARGKGITNLKGLEKCSNLVLIDFAGNEIVDL